MLNDSQVINFVLFGPVDITLFIKMKRSGTNLGPGQASWR